MSQKKVIIVFTTTHADTIGNECRLTLMTYLCSYYQATIVTDKVEFVNNKFPTSKVMDFKPSLGRFIAFKKVIFWRKLAEFVNRLDGDFVFLFHNEAPSAIWINKPVFQYIHQYGRRFTPKGFYKTIKLNFFEKIYDSLSIRGFNKSKLNFAISPFLVGYFQSLGVKNLAYSPHGIELVKFQNPVITEFHDVLIQAQRAGKFLIAYTGWISENRGFDLLLAAIKKLNEIDSRYMMVICGANEHFSTKIEDFKRQHNLHSQIVNFGIVDSGFVPGILANVDVCTSFWDTDVPGFNLAPPQKVFEYFAAGKPVICNDIPTHSLYVSDNFSGALINNDVNQFVQVVNRLADDRQLMEKIKTNCLNESLKYDSREVYQKICNQIDVCL